MKFTSPSLYMNIEFEHHKGKMHKEEGYVIFYGLLFDSINSAANFLRNTSAGTYKGVYFSDDKILVNPIEDTFYCGKTWNMGWKSFKTELRAIQKL